MEASAKIVSGAIGCGSSTLVTPNPRVVTRSSRKTPSATPGIRYSRIFCSTSDASRSNGAPDCAIAADGRGTAATPARIATTTTASFTVARRADRPIFARSTPDEYIRHLPSRMFFPDIEF